jgi:NAD(P)-dependent dehydrogenase (short-subunit alcohol dehydrogenase family)
MNNTKIALITGANKGIGKEIARQLGAQGLTVLLGARDAERGEEAAGELKANGANAHAVQLDVTDEASIEGAARHIEQEFGGLDVLVNNAGVALDSVPPSQLDRDTLRRTFETNVFGVVGVTQAMLPLLKKSPAGRIVNLSSGLASLAQNSDPNWDYAGINLVAYNSSKAALNMVTVTFAKELKDTPIKVNAADPGYTATDMNGHQGTRTVEQGATAAVRLATLPDDGPTGSFFDEDGVVPW